MADEKLIPVVDDVEQLTEKQKLELSDGKGKENILAGIGNAVKASLTASAVGAKKTYSPLAMLIVPSPFYTAPRYNKIDTIIVHHMSGNLSAKLCGQWFQNPSARCSSNYGVGSDGMIAGYVPEEYRAWTTGNQVDHRAITIEVADDCTNPWHCSDKAYKATVKLVADICKRNGIKKLVFTGDKSGNLQWHRWYQQTDCPASWWMAKERSGDFTEDVNAILEGKAKYTGKLPTKIPKRGYYKAGDGYETYKSYTTQIKRIQMFLNWKEGTCLAVDGWYGEKTNKAVLLFQKAEGMKGTHGNWGAGTQEKAKKYL